MVLQSLMESFPGLFMQSVPVYGGDGGTILTSPFFVNVILPFILIFTVIFAILQKSQILGKGKKQIDAIVSLVIALIVISFANAVGVITSLMPFLAVSVIVILVFLILFGMLHKEGEFSIHKGLRIALGIVAGIAVIIAVLLSTGAWDYIRYTWLFGANSSAIITNIVFLIIVAVAIVVVLWPSKKDEST